MKNYMICITDDDEDDFFILKDVFNTLQLSYQFKYLKDGEELIDYLTSTPVKEMFPDIILLDYNMPKKNGLETLIEIRKHSDFAAIPIIIYSTSDCPDLHQLALNNGANGYVTKDISTEKTIEFIKGIDAYLNGVGDIPGKIYKSQNKAFLDLLTILIQK